MKDLTIIVPTLNEEESIKELIRQVKKAAPGAGIIIADDGSKDRTRELAEKAGAEVIDRSKEKVKGLTASVIDAIKQVTTKYAVVIDGDLQHPPEKISELISKLKEGYPLVIGVRERVDSRWPLHRKLESKAATALGSLKLAGKDFSRTDIMSGFFGCRTELFTETYSRNRKRFIGQGFKVLFDLLKCLPKDTRYAETGYVFGKRGKGKSKIGTRHIYYYLKSLAT